MALTKQSKRIFRRASADAVATAPGGTIEHDHGERCATARLSRDRDRRRALLGRGLVSNTPLQWVVEQEPRRDTLAFQIDLSSAHGEFPRNMLEVMAREKEIRYSSRTRAGTDQFKHVQRLRGAAAGLLEKLPDDLKNSPEVQLLRPAVDRKVYNIVQLIYRAKNYESVR